MIIPPRLGIAVPKYMEQKAMDAELPPGHRFNLYAPMWIKEPYFDGKKSDGAVFDLGSNINEILEKRDKPTGAITREGRKERKNGKQNVLDLVSKKYSTVTLNLLNALIERQLVIAKKLNTLVLPIQLTAPFAVGLGNAHPVENGFSFLSPYGLPYIAGSGLKGVFRKAAQDSGLFDDEEIVFLFGNEDTSNASKGVLSFWDGFPQCEKMDVEVMTPHQSSYYDGMSSPHDQGTPTPIPFLVVPYNTKMNLIIQCNESRLNNRIEDWQDKVVEIVKYASKWLGFGAKTSVGYGSFELDKDFLVKRDQVAEQRKEENRLALMNPEEREREENLKIFNQLKEDYDAIRSKEKIYNVGSSKLNAKLNSIYEICGKLKDENAKLLLNDILAFVKSNDRKKKEVKGKLSDFGLN